MHRGQCSSCGRSLEPNQISVFEHSRILREVEEAITRLEERFTDYSKEFQLCYLKKMVHQHGFGAVVDGMNVGMGGGTGDFRVPRVSHCGLRVTSVY